MEKDKKLNPSLPSGFEDRWNKKLVLKKQLLKVIEKNFLKFGAEPLETPSFEISENIGSFLAEDEDNPMSDVFSFKDGDKNITLRYDLSSPLARFVAQNNQELPSIYKRYAIQNVFRNEKAGNGRYREFMQADFDIVGNVNSAQANAELCNLISSTLLDCGLNKDQFTINISNRKIVQGLIDDLKISEDKQLKVIRAIDKLDKPGFGLKGVEDLLKKERKDASGAVTKGADLTDEQASQILNFLKIKDLKQLKENLKNPLSQEGIKELEEVFEILGFSVTDYHKPGSKCGGTAGNSDDIKGLIKFVRGQDYFTYGAKCSEKGNIRDSVLGDIYHSQIVEVGAPSANTLYTSTNQEAYYRAKNGYRTWANSLSERPRTLYVGANDGMLHAFNSKTGKEEWAFVPPFVASSMPNMVNVNLNLSLIHI